VVKVNRELLLQQLESVQPGLSTREIVEQSSCFCFRGGMVFTFNEEIACSHECNLPLEGAIQAAPFLAILRKLPDEELEVVEAEGEIQLFGKRRTLGIRRESDFLLPIDSVELPKKWKPLPAEFLEAIGIVQTCVGKDESFFSMTCVHVHPDYLEACDNTQLCRYALTTNVREEFLVRGSSVKHITSLGMIEFSETKSWLHFRSSSGLILSCRRYIEEFPDLSKLLKCRGIKTTLPKGLVEAAEKASVFSAENVDANQVTIELRPGKLRIRGQGISGWYTETKKIQYDGEPILFLVSPQLLSEITQRYNECEISQERLKVEGKGFTYVTCLGAPAAEKETEPAEEAVVE